MDTDLDRPVRIRTIGPYSSPERAQEFLSSTRVAAACNHPHLVPVFAAALTEGGAYSISGWSTGSNWEDRLANSHPLDPEEFAQNAAGLADALALLHRNGVVHGHIDLSAVAHSPSHPARLGAYGRPSTEPTRTQDVIALGQVLEQSLTGERQIGSNPSQMVDGLSPRVDRILRRAQQGACNARQLADDLASLPQPTPRDPAPPRRSARLLVATALLVLSAVFLLVVGGLVVGNTSDQVRLPPNLSDTSPTVLPSTTTSVAEPTPVLILVTARNPQSYDPFGQGGENDQILDNLVDGDLSTFWRTERYFDPIAELKPGVGVTFETGSTPRRLEVAGISPGVGYQLGWAPEIPDSLAQWEFFAAGQTSGGLLSVSVPPRTGGVWLLWITEVPQLGEDNHLAEIAEIRLLV